MFLRTIFAAEQKPPAPDDNFWYRPIGEAGDGVDADTAQRVTAVYACNKVISETVSMLPLKIYERQSDGGRREATEHPLYELLHDQPNLINTSLEFREFTQSNLTLRGNGYSLIIPGKRGAVDRLEPLRSERMRVEKLPNGRARYQYQEPNGTKKIFTQDEIFHLRGYGDSIEGLSPIGVHRQAVYRALATDKYASQFFSNGARPGGLIEYDGKLQKDTADLFREQWQKAFGGSNNSHGTAILESGMKWKPVSISNEDAQFIETRQYNVRDIARIFRIPPHLVGDLEKASFSNIEQQSLEFVMYSMYPWFVRWEQAIRRDLISDKQKYFAAFSFDALLRGDAAARGAIYTSGINSGWLMRNEARKLENLNPKPGLDEPLQPLNTAPVTGNSRGNAAKDVLSIMVKDCAARVVSCERRELGKIFQGQSATAAVMNEVEQFYSRNDTYFKKTFAPVQDVMNALGYVTLTTTAESVTNYIHAQKLHFQSADSIFEFQKFLEENADGVLCRLILGE